MESVYQDEGFTPEAELTPPDQLKLQWSQQPGFLPLIRQKNLIDSNTELVRFAGAVSLPGWISPWMFALQGLVLISLALSLVNWQLTRHAGTLQDQIVALEADTQTEVRRQEDIISATEAEIRRVSHSLSPVFKLHLSATPLTREQALRALNSSLEESQRSEAQYKEKMEAQERKLRAEQNALALAHSGSPLIFSVALVLAAVLVGKGAQKSFPRARYAQRLSDFYLYFATAEGLWPNLVLLVFLHVALSRDPYGLSGLFGSVGPLFWVVFGIGFYFLLLRFFVMVARDLNQALEIRPPVNEWSTENRMLLRVHNSFLLIFAAMQAVFLGLCYAMYVAQN
jgi:hypothetical protein